MTRTEIDPSYLPILSPSSFEDWGAGLPVEQLLRDAEELRAAHDLNVAAEDAVRTVLLLIDVQKDFCLPGGSLFVGGRSGRGAVEDNQRLADFMLRNLTQVTEIVATLDSHHPFQIFFPTFWRTAQGTVPSPFTVIGVEDVVAGRYRPNAEMVSALGLPSYSWLQREVRHYCERLDGTGRYGLSLWPFHCLVGAPGSDMVGAINDVRLFHGFVRQSVNPMVSKGSCALTENYSVFAPEVAHDHEGRPHEGHQDALLASVLGADRLIVAGQASSHCVRSSLEDLAKARKDLQSRGEEPAEIFVLEDCMSPVTVADPDQPEAWISDFTEEAAASLRRLEADGFNIVRSDLQLANLS